MSTPARLLSSSPAMCWGVPTPGEANDSFPGWALHKQLRDAFRWHFVVDSKDARHHQNASNRREIARWIEGGTRLKRRVDSHCAVSPPIERAAVGGRFCHSLGPHTPARTWNILDRRRRFPRFIEFLRKEAGRNVGSAARREADDDAHRPAWVALRPSEARDGRQRGSARGQTQKSTAGTFHFRQSLIGRFIRSPRRRAAGESKAHRDRVFWRS